jgi:Spy/CpxP family protein refolding chaperone
MKIKIILLVLALGASTWLLAAQDTNSPSDEQRPPGREGGSGAPGGFHLLPPRAQEQLNLTTDQQKQVAALEAETKAKLEKILTPAQLQQLKQMRPPRRQGGPGGEDRPQSPDQEK